jgi:soluble lytic murein transglycosylase-like protein
MSCRAIVLAAWLVAGLVDRVPAAEPFYYYVQGERIVITNTPDRADARPLPATSRPLGAAHGAALPALGLRPTPYDAQIERAARESGLSPELIRAVVQVESGFDPLAVSPKGAQGLMQLMPATAARYGVADAFDPLENLLGGARHLRDLLREFDGDLSLALAAYNSGAGAVRRHGGIPAYRETRDYVKKVQRRMGGDGAPLRPARPVRVVRRSDGSVLLSNE